MTWAGFLYYHVHMSLSAITFHESYGYLPRYTLGLIRKYNVSPADFDSIMRAFGWEPYPPEGVGIDWDAIDDFMHAGSPDGYYRPSKYL